MPIRIALGEDSLLVREGLQRLLGGDPELDLVAAVGDLDSLRDACARERPDVVLTDIRMPPDRDRRGHPGRGRAARHRPEIGVVVLSQYADPSYALALLERGSDGRAYLLKERVHDRAELTAAIRAVADGGSVIDPKVVEALVAGPQRGRALAARRS